MATITLVTGVPGSGKTALVVDMLVDVKDRPIFAMGIPELTIEHNKVPPVSEWTEMRPDPDDESLKLAYFTFPANSLIVLDEAQRIYRPRGVGSKVPPEVAAFETFRHTGVDFILMTQHPNLLDSNIRKLIGRHIHVDCTAFGKYRYEWPKLGDPESKGSRDLASRERFKPPKRAFPLYKSSELHTVTKVKKPWFYYMFIFAALIALALAWRVYTRVNTIMNPDQVVPAGSNVSPSATRTSQGKVTLTKQEYLDREIPRVHGLPWTAPVYDELTKVTEAPTIGGCLVSKKGCKCYTQQATPVPTPDEICLQIVANGLFRSWEPASVVSLREEEKQKRRDDQRPASADVITGASDTGVYGAPIGDLPGGSHNFAGGLAPEVKKPDNTYVIKASG